uniref:EF-hand domain-containing protein n=4 Tax=Parascaris TaxID=6254 RepID=A0A915C021_PARUN
CSLYDRLHVIKACCYTTLILMFARNVSPTKQIAFEFAKLDSDGDGTIPLSEVRHMLSENRRQVGLNDHQILTLLDRADADHNGVLDLEEFSLLITSARAQPSRARRVLYSVADSVIAKSERPTVHSYINEYNCLPPPIFVIMISLAQILVFVGYMHGKHEDSMSHCAGCWVHGRIGPLLFAPPLRHQVWRFFTYQFLHQGLLHLVPNVAFQLLVGVPLELVHKMWRIAPIYLLAVILGALLQYTLDPSVYLVGCSAGVYALITAHLSNLIINWAEMPFRLIRLIVISTYFILDIGSAVYRRLQTDECDRVSYTAHIAGAVTGLLMGIALLYNLKVLKWERALMIASLSVYLIILIFVIIMAIFVEPFSRPVWDTTRCISEADSYFE